MVTVKLEMIKGTEWVEKEVTLDVETDMSLSDETLEKDMAALPRKLSYYAELRAELQAQASRRKRRVEQAEAEAAQAIRNSGVKVTEAGVQEQVSVRPEVIAVTEGYINSVMWAAKVEGFYYALRDKASLATALCYKQKEELKFMGNS